MRSHAPFALAAVLIAASISPGLSANRPLYLYTRLGKADFEVQGNDLLGHVNGDLCLWDLQTGKLRIRLSGKTKGIQSVQLSPDHKTAVSCSPRFRTDFMSKDVGTTLWNLVSRRATLMLPGNIMPQFSADGRTLLSLDITGWHGQGYLVKARITSTSSGQELFEVPLHNFQLGDDQLIFAPDGRAFAWFQSDLLRLFDAADGKELRRYSYNSGIGCRFNHSGSQIIVYGASGIDIFEPNRKETKHLTCSNEATGRQREVISADIGASSQQAIGICDDLLYIWSEKSGASSSSYKVPGTAIGVIADPYDAFAVLDWGEKDSLNGSGHIIYNWNRGIAVNLQQKEFRSFLAFSRDSKWIYTIRLPEIDQDSVANGSVQRRIRLEGVPDNQWAYQ